MIARLSGWTRMVLSQVLRGMGTRISGTPLREVGMGDGQVVGGAQAIRAGEGRKWHRLVARSVAEAYARGHGRTRSQSGGWAGRDTVIQCGQRINALALAEVRIFEDRPDSDACGKCWDE